MLYDAIVGIGAGLAQLSACAAVVGCFQLVLKDDGIGRYLVGLGIRGYGRKFGIYSRRFFVFLEGIGYQYALLARIFIFI